MNTLILTFGDDLCQKVNRDCITKMFSRGIDNCYHFDVLKHELDLYKRNCETDRNNYHDMMRNYIMIRETLSTRNVIKEFITNKEIDVIICLHNTLISCIDAVITENSFNVLVYCIVMDANLISCDSSVVDKYVVFTDSDSEYLNSIGIDSVKTLKNLAFWLNVEPNPAKCDYNVAANLDFPVVIFVSDGKDEAMIRKFLKVFSSSSIKDTNLILALKRNFNLCDSINEEYYKFKNICAFVVGENVYDYISQCDIVVLDSDINPALHAINCHKPLIVYERSFDDVDILKSFVRKRYAVAEKNSEELVKQLGYAVMYDTARNNYIKWQKELQSNLPHDLLYNDIVNNKFTYKKGEKQWTTEF